jgi:excisionase family DNA binding protein
VFDVVPEEVPAVPVNNPNGLPAPAARPAGVRALPPGPQLGREVFTTGQVARLVGVSANTVAGWCDQGLLPHYRIPTGRDRRVRRADLEAFARGHGLWPLLEALGASQGPAGRLVVCGCPDALAGLLGPMLPGWAVAGAGSLLEAGTLLPGEGACVLLLGPCVPRADVRDAARWLAGRSDWRALALLGEDQQPGLARAVRLPCDPGLIADAVRALVEG